MCVYGLKTQRRRDSLSHNMSAVQAILSSLICLLLPSGLIAGLSGFLERVCLQLMSIFFCPHISFSHLFLPSFLPWFSFYFFPTLFSIVLFVFSPLPSFTLFLHCSHPLSCSVIVEVCSSLLFLSI